MRANGSIRHSMPYVLCWFFFSFTFAGSNAEEANVYIFGIYLNQKQSIRRFVEVVTAIKQFAWREIEKPTTTTTGIRMWCKETTTRQKDKKTTSLSHDNQLLGVPYSNAKISALRFVKKHQSTQANLMEITDNTKLLKSQHINSNTPLAKHREHRHRSTHEIYVCINKYKYKIHIPHANIRTYT